MKSYLSTPPNKKALLTTLAALLTLGAFTAAYWFGSPALSDALRASRSLVFGSHQYWRLFTSPLIHRDVEHFASDSVFFAILSFLLNAYFGAWVFPFGVLALGALVQGLALSRMDANLELLGSSGIVYLMAGFWLALFVLLERGLSVGGRLVRAIGFFLIILIPSRFEPEVSYRTHAIGFAVGLIAGAFYFIGRKSWLRSFEKEELSFREAGPQDDERVGEFLVHVFDTTYAQKKPEWKNPEARKAELRDMRGKRENGLVIVAELGKKLVGTVTLYPPTSPNARVWLPECAELRFLAVDPELQGQNLGERILRVAHDQVLGWGLSRVAIRVRRGLPRLMEFYQRHGYVRDERGDEEKYPGVLVDGFVAELD